MSSGPDRATIKATIRAQSDAEPEFAVARIKSQAERVEIDGRIAFFRMRSTWSIAIMVWISIFIAFHVTLTFFIGWGWLDFTKYKWLIPTMVGENFLQIVGMGYIVVRFLYPGEKNVKPTPTSKARSNIRKLESSAAPAE